MSAPMVGQSNYFEVKSDGSWRIRSEVNGQVVRDESGENYWGPRARVSCRVYWGSHGCMLERGHEGDHRCHCDLDGDFDPVTRLDADGVVNVGAPPYYGAETRFYGEDAKALGLPLAGE